MNAAVARVLLCAALVALLIPDATVRAASGEYTIEVSWTAAGGRQVVVRDRHSGAAVRGGRIPFAMGDAVTVEAGPSATFVGRTESYRAHIGCVREKTQRPQRRCEPYTWTERKRGCWGFCTRTIIHEDWHCFDDMITDYKRGQVEKESASLPVEATTFRNIVPILTVERPVDPTAMPIPMVLKRTDAGGPGTQFVQVAPTTGFVRFDAVDVPAGLFWRQGEAPDPAVRDELDRQIREWMGTLCDAPAGDGCLMGKSGTYECEPDQAPQLASVTGGERYKMTINVRVRTPIAGGRP